MTRSDSSSTTNHAPLAYYETDSGLAILCQDCAERREQERETCEWFDTLENVGQLINLIQCEDCDALPYSHTLTPPTKRSPL